MRRGELNRAFNNLARAATGTSVVTGTPPTATLRGIVTSTTPLRARVGIAATATPVTNVAPSYIPAVGDIVLVARIGRQQYILGGMEPAGPVVDPGLLLVDDCENYTDAPWTLAGSPTIAAGKNGNGFSIPTGTANTAAFNIPAGNQTDELTFGAWVRFSAFPTLNRTYVAFQSDAGATTHNIIRVINTGADNANARVYMASTILCQTTTKPIVLNTWHYLEVYVRLGDAPNGAATLKVDGATLGTATGVDTKNAGTKTVYDRVLIAGVSDGGWQLDDIYLRNDGAFAT